MHYFKRAICKRHRSSVILLLNGLVLLTLLFLSGCGSLTGIPSHGGGKRFAIEQEMVAATTRATIKNIDLTAIRGKKVNLFVNAIGDTGAGNIIGGRFSLVSQIRGDYLQSPVTTEKSFFKRYTSSTATSSRTNGYSTTDTDNVSSTSSSDSTSSTSGTSSNNSSSSTSGTSTTSTLLGYPERKETSQKGSGGEVQVGIQYKGLGAYQNSDRISSDDLQYLSGLLQTYLFLSGVHIVPPSEAEIDVYVTVDVFGTVRTRVEWFIANNEILRAKTALEVMAVDHMSGTLVMPPQSTCTEAVYNEQYILWAGPVLVTKFLKRSEPLLVDFTDLQNNAGTTDYHDQDGMISYPFKHQLEKWQKTRKKNGHTAVHHNETSYESAR